MWQHVKEVFLGKTLDSTFSEEVVVGDVLVSKGVVVSHGYLAGLLMLYPVFPPTAPINVKRCFLFFTS